MVRTTKIRCIIGFLIAAFAAATFSSCSSESGPTTYDPSPPIVQRPPFDWATSTPFAQNLDTVKIDSALQIARLRTYIYSFLIVRNGYLVVEWYMDGFSEFNDFEIRSVTKSFTSSLVGVGFQEGLFDSLGQSFLWFFPEYQTTGLDIRKLDITIEHLLTMRAGFDYVEGNDYSNVYLPDSDWLKTTIDLPLKADPGAQFIYASPVSHLLSGLITKASGMSSLDFAEQHLFSFLQISPRVWDRDPMGIYQGGTGMNFTARDLARFGYLYLNQGNVDGTQILPADWIQRTFEPKNAQDIVWGDFLNVNYGYQWWNNIGSPDTLYLAAGYGGQFIMVYPKANMVVVTTADPNVIQSKATEQELTIINLISRHVLPAIQY